MKQMDNDDIKNIKLYEEAIVHYENALKMINEAYDKFYNSPWGLPEQFEMLFGERQGNETLYLLEKEVKHLKEIRENEDKF